ncbi:hypothetical protein [uncultured Cellulomonas sp.]|uniref:hypothetical protein n=1 Tax=uncultured Cellulomonas sp. TaxID=189682 RepID=UPI0028E928A2|nr:hypothetical protein [uncultured Cellulomonas sp.]
MSESVNTPDPVERTAPDAPPPPDEQNSDAYLERDTGAVLPVAGPQAGTVPAARPVTGNG